MDTERLIIDEIRADDKEDLCVDSSNESPAAIAETIINSLS